MVSGQQEIFLNYGRRGMNAAFAESHKSRLEDEIRTHGKAWDHAGGRVSVVNSEESRADRWMKSNFELHSIDSHDISGIQISFYEILLNGIDREAR